MALISIKREVDLQPGLNAPAVFHCSQGDVGTTIMLGLLNGGEDYSITQSTTIQIKGSRSNGEVFSAVNATWSGSTVSFALTAEMTATAGPTWCEAVLTRGSDILGTANFILDVEESPTGAAPRDTTDATWAWILNKLSTEQVAALDDLSVIDAIDDNQGVLGTYLYDKLLVKQGEILMQDGTIDDTSRIWCYSPNFIPKSYVIKTTHPVRMYLMAYDAKTMDFIGGWNGSAFTNSYLAGSFMYTIDFEEWSNNYPDYLFKVNFFDYQTTMVPSAVYSALQITDKKELVVDGIQGAQGTYLYGRIFVEQGWIHIPDGIIKDSNTWCYSPNFIPKNYVLKTTHPVRMYLMAFNAKTLDYVGGWNGSAFTREYLAGSFMYEIDFEEWSNNYPDYLFKVNFFDYRTTMVPDAVYSALEITDKEEVKLEEAQKDKKALADYKYNDLNVTQGQISQTTGEVVASSTYCYSTDFIPEDRILTTERPLRMYLYAYNADTFAYVGGWNGSAFTTSYSSNGWLYTIDFHEWKKQYPNYVFKVSYFDYQTSLAPAGVESKLHVLTYDEIRTGYRFVDYLDKWEVGSVTGNVPVVTDIRLRYTETLSLAPGSWLSCVGSDLEFMVLLFNDVGDKIGGGSSWETSWVIGEACTVQLLVRKADGSTITLDDLSKLKMRLIIPKTPDLNVRVVPQKSIGDSMIIKSGGKTILLDMGKQQYYSRLKQALECECVTKIDYVIISHYHGDHINTSNVTSLISDFDLSDCMFILPPAIPDTFTDSDNVYTRQTEVLALLNANNISYINTYDYDTRHMWLGGVRYDFYNLDHDDWYSQGYDYNQMSVVCVANVGNTTVFFTGDMGQPLETKLIDMFNNRITIAKFGHHGLNETLNLDFWHKIRPEVIWSCSPEEWHDALYLTSHQIRFANYNGIPNIMTNTSGTIYIHCDEGGYSVSGYNFMLDNLTSSEFFDYVL